MSWSSKFRLLVGFVSNHIFILYKKGLSTNQYSLYSRTNFSCLTSALQVFSICRYKQLNESSLKLSENNIKYVLIMVFAAFDSILFAALFVGFCIVLCMCYIWHG
ncbi:hypothetical protein EDC96DRAFT_543498 [Choanephora cucurbitarum]|nr:hypothetical protein EDC96DRAFT_543498 [Choanephora cucurbitarum]